MITKLTFDFDDDGRALQVTGAFDPGQPPSRDDYWGVGDMFDVDHIVDAKTKKAVEDWPSEDRLTEAASIAYREMGECILEARQDAKIKQRQA